MGTERRLRVPLLYRTHLLDEWNADDRKQEQEQVRNALLGRLRHCAASWFSDDQLASVQFLNRHSGDITSLLGAMSSDPGDAHEALDIISGLRYYWQLHPVDPWPHVRDWLETALAIDPIQDTITVRAVQSDAYIAFHEGDLDGAKAQLKVARTSFDMSLSRPGEILFGTFVEALVDLAEGNVETAAHKLSRVLQEFLDADVRDHLGEKYWYLATCQVALGQEDHALVTLRDGLAYCQRVGDDWGRAYMWWLLALIADRQGRSAEAVSRVRDSVEVMADFGDRAGLALCVRLLGSISAHSEDDSAARLIMLVPRPMRAAPPVPLPELSPSPHLSTDSPVGFPDNQSLTEMLKRIIDGDTSPAATPRSGSADALSTREWEIATLVAEGLGNPAIAARLVLSRRTVEGHVQRILAKLGFRSRSQIAVWVSQRSDGAPSRDPRPAAPGPIHR